MVVPIPIFRTVQVVDQIVWKLVDCENCREKFAYLISLQAHGKVIDLLLLNVDESKRRAQEAANENLLKQIRNICVPTPCPNCGYYNADMARLLKDNASINGQQIVGGLCMIGSFLPYPLGWPFSWLPTTILAAIGATFMFWGYARSFRYDPNQGNADERIQWSRQYAIHGDTLRELLEKHPHHNGFVPFSYPDATPHNESTSHTVS